MAKVGDNPPPRVLLPPHIFVYCIYTIMENI